MIVYLTIILFILFLLLQEKNQKKQSQGALSVLLPQSDPPPCVSPGRIAGSWSHFNLDSVQAENVPIFCLKITSVNIGRAASAAAAANSKTIRLFFSSLRCWAVVAVRPGGVHRGGWIGLREQDIQRRPYASFFGYFLVWYKKVT